MSLGGLETIVSAEPLVVLDADTRVLHLNQPAEALLGTTAAEAVGKTCHAVLHPRTAGGRAACTSGCRQARLARWGWPVPPAQLIIESALGPRRVDVSTIVLHAPDGPLLCRVLHPGASVALDGPATAGTALTSRQYEVLRLLADGVPARGVADRLGIAETTVRNHIRAILIGLGVHSQLEAVKRARDLGLVA